MGVEITMTWTLGLLWGGLALAEDPMPPVDVEALRQGVREQCHAMADAKIHGRWRCLDPPAPEVTTPSGGDVALNAVSGEHDLDTTAGREAWVAHCVAQGWELERKCDLQFVLPYDPAWWTARHSHAPPPQVIVLTGQPADVLGGEPGEGKRLVWVLHREELSGGRVCRSHSLVVDAYTGRTMGLGTVRTDHCG